MKTVKNEINAVEGDDKGVGAGKGAGVGQNEGEGADERHHPSSRWTLYLWHHVTMMIRPPGAVTLKSSFTNCFLSGMCSPLSMDQAVGVTGVRCTIVSH